MPQLPTQGTVLQNRYRVIRLIGQGGMSAIYLCDDLHLVGKVWALKQMTAQFDDPKDEQAAVQMFRTEAVTLAHLEHPSLPKVIDYFSTKNYHYLVMEFVEGEDLGKVIRNTQGFLPERQIILWGIEIAKILYFLHQQNPPIIFRDLKPANVMLSKGRIKLIDFGIARLFNPQKSQDTFTFGSPGYASPEHYGGKQTDVRSDVYSLGVCLHELLTKSDPVKNNPAFQFQGIRNLNPAVSQELEDLVNRALSIDPALRPQSALEFKKALEALLGRGDTTQIIPQILQPVAPQPAVVSLQPQQPASQPHLPVQPLSHPPFPVLLPRGATRRRPPTPVMKWIIVAFALLMTIWSLATGVPKWLRLTQSEVSGKTPSPSPVVYQPPVPPPRPGKNVLGINSYNAGKYNEALDFLEEYRNDHPTDGEVFLYKQNVLAASQSKPQLILKVLRSTRRAPYRNTESVLRGLALGIEAINTAGGIEGALLQAVPISSDIGIGKSSIRHLSTWAQCAAVLGATFEKPVNEREWRGLLEDSGIPNLFPTVNPGVLHTTMKEVADRKDLAELGLELVRGDPGYVEDFLLRAPQSGHNFFFFPPVVLTDSTLRVTRLAPNSTFYALSFFDPNTPTGDALHFVQAHKKTFPRVYPDPWAALGYDSVGYLASLLKEAGADWASASQASREKEYQGITGKITKGSGLLPSQWFLVKVNLAEINRIQEVRNLP